jgi:hypothetical protein
VKNKEVSDPGQITLDQILGAVRQIFEQMEASSDQNKE